MSISVAMLLMAACLETFLKSRLPGAERFTYDNEHTSTTTTEGENA